MFGLRHSRTANEQRGLDRHGEPEPTNLVCLWVVRTGACTFGAPSGLGSHRYAEESISTALDRIEVLQGLVTALMKRPSPDCPADAVSAFGLAAGMKPCAGRIPC